MAGRGATVATVSDTGNTGGEEKMTDRHRIILNIKNMENVTLAARAARYLIDKPESTDALLDYGDGQVLIYARRNKASISVWEQE